MKPTPKRQRLLLPKQEVSTVLPQAHTVPSASDTAASGAQRPLLAAREHKATQVQSPVAHTLSIAQVSQQWPKMAPQSDTQWEQIKEFIRAHHIEQDNPLTLKEVIPLIEDRLGFSVT